MRAVGIDLTGSEKRPSGFAFLEDNTLVKTVRLKSNMDMIENTIACLPDIISIDSPLSLPEDPKKIYRDCELQLKRRGIGASKIKFAEELKAYDWKPAVR